MYILVNDVETVYSHAEKIPSKDLWRPPESRNELKEALDDKVTSCQCYSQLNRKIELNHVFLIT